MSIDYLCELLGYSKQAYYKRIRNQEKENFEEALIVEMIKEKKGSYGKKVVGEIYMHR